MKWNNYAFIILFILIIFSLITIFYNKFNWGIDFTGGTVIELYFKKPITNINYVKSLIQNKYSSNINIMSFNNHNYFIKIAKKQPIIKNNVSINYEEILDILSKQLKQRYTIKNIESIGPSIDNNLILSGISAIILTLFGVGLFIGLRFGWNPALSTILSLLHDLIITLGLISLLNIEVDITIIASLISIISYSLNDSIVTLDRIRENSYKLKNYNINMYQIINLSINQTIKRSIITSCIILIMTLNLYFFGGILLKNFALIMIIGVFVGTISSIYVVSAFSLRMKTQNNSLY
ncbi:protein translocase subunit SecF [Enterobacteriaceae endosymbiont of Donacia tomentosa]|uniref:protein translocase subunit SecF n=1 Tax=Enterobacteriaceae endosymbiont of Donacia tomentosa TaxID=2675787 RepID=UPI0014569B69|nr:protein translocase subunit SecF [Enterobacteriaceae endosymbiont of Donacia tomentosa]